MSALARRVAHDVGKYVARIARNLPVGTAPSPELLALLCGDLYAPSASRRLADLVTSTPLAEDPRVRDAAQLLATIDLLEPRVRAGDPAAVAEAAAAALTVERLLREVAA